MIAKLGLPNGGLDGTANSNRNEHLFSNLSIKNAEENGDVPLKMLVLY